MSYQGSFIIVCVLLLSACGSDDDSVGSPDPASSERTSKVSSSQRIERCERIGRNDVGCRYLEEEKLLNDDGAEDLDRSCRNAESLLYTIHVEGFDIDDVVPPIPEGLPEKHADRYCDALEERGAGIYDHDAVSQWSDDEKEGAERVRILECMFADDKVAAIFTVEGAKRGTGYARAADRMAECERDP